MMVSINKNCVFFIATMSHGNNFNCKRDSKGKFVKTKKYEWRQNVLEGIKRRTLKLRAKEDTDPKQGTVNQTACETDVPETIQCNLDSTPREILAAGQQESVPGHENDRSINPSPPQTIEAAGTRQDKSQSAEQYHSVQLDHTYGESFISYSGIPRGKNTLSSPIEPLV